MSMLLPGLALGAVALATLVIVVLLLPTKGGRP